MGHYSRFTLRFSDAATFDSVRATILAHHSYRDYLDTERELVSLPDGRVLVSANWNGNDTMKWYEWRHDMQAISRALPGVTLELERIGEMWWDDDHHDVWRVTYLDGVEVREEEGRSQDGVAFAPRGADSQED